MAASPPPGSLPALPVVERRRGRSAPPDDLGALLRTTLRSWFGRSAAVALLVKLVVALVGGATPAWLRLVDSSATIVLLRIDAVGEETE